MTAKANRNYGAMIATNFNRVILMAGMALGIDQAMEMLPRLHSRGGTPVKRGVASTRRTTLFNPNGEQECERRRRQIAGGQLKKENGFHAD